MHRQKHLSKSRYLWRRSRVDPGLIDPGSIDVGLIDAGSAHAGLELVAERVDEHQGSVVA